MELVSTQQLGNKSSLSFRKVFLINIAKIVNLMLKLVKKKEKKKSSLDRMKNPCVMKYSKGKINFYCFKFPF